MKRLACLLFIFMISYGLPVLSATIEEGRTRPASGVVSAEA